MNLNITPYKPYVSKNTVNSTQSIAPNKQNKASMIGFCANDQFVRREAVKLADAFKSVLKSVASNTFKEVRVPFVNPDPVEIRLEELYLSANKLPTGKVCFDVEYVNPNGSGSIPINREEVFGLEKNPEKADSLINKIKKELKQESDDLRNDVTRRMDDGF